MSDFSKMSNEELIGIVYPHQNSNLPETSVDSNQPIIKNEETPSDLSKVDTETLKKIAGIGQSSQSTLGESVGKGAISLASGVLEGTADTAETIGKSAKMVAKAGAKLRPDAEIAKGYVDFASNLVSDYYDNTFRKWLDNKSQLEKKSIAEHPIAFGVGGGAANVLGMTAAGNAIASPILKGTEVMSSVLPRILSGPVGKEIFKQGLTGASVGALSTPDHPLVGAMAGGTVGAAIGGTLGYIGTRVNRANSIIESELKNASEAGIPIKDPAVYRRIKTELNSKGIEYNNRDTANKVQSIINGKIAEMSPKTVIAEDPVKTVLKNASANFKLAEAKSDSLYGPLDAAPGTAVPATIKQVLVENKDLVPSLGLPNSKLTDNTTIKNLLDYRRSVKALETAAFKQVRNGTMRMEQAGFYSSLKDAAEADLLNLAKSQGLEKQLLQADTNYAETMVPFQIFNKGKRIMDPEKSASAWDKINMLLKSPRPKAEPLLQAASALGPDGKRIVGYALLQYQFNKSFNAQGEFMANKFSTAMRMYNASKLQNEVLLPEHQEAFQGIRKLAESATQLQKAGGEITPKEGFFSKINNTIDGLTHSEAGIDLLRFLGKQPVKEIRQILKDSFVGYSAITKSKEAEDKLKQR